MMSDKSDDLPIDDKAMRSLLASDTNAAPQRKNTDNPVMRRIRANISQRDTILFTCVKFWTTVAKMLAPIFAHFATKKTAISSNIHRPKTTDKK
jgi:hypothetical protein